MISDPNVGFNLGSPVVETGRYFPRYTASSLRKRVRARTDADHRSRLAQESRILAERTRLHATHGRSLSAPRYWPSSSPGTGPRPGRRRPGPQRYRRQAGTALSPEIEATRLWLSDVGTRLSAGSLAAARPTRRGACPRGHGLPIRWTPSSIRLDSVSFRAQFAHRINYAI